MKKTLLLGSLAIFGLVANAQLVTQATTESLDAAGIYSGDKVPNEAGVVIAEGEAGTIALAFDDSWNTMAPCGDYKNVKVNELEVALNGGGAAGNTNPTFTSYAEGFTAGAVFEITPAADGWLTVFTKMNPNKQYVVMEGQTGPMSYTLGYTNGTEKIQYTLPYDEDFYINFEDYVMAGHELEYYDEEQTSLKYSYFVPSGGELGTDLVKPNFPWKVVGLETNPSDNTGFVTFNVLGGNTYYFGALGSKAGCGVIVLTEGEEMPTITYSATDALPEVVFAADNAGVGSIAADNYDVNAPVYNVMGQKVNDDYKGIVIKNGKKFIRR
ncbi:MAG: hypothetical protein J1F67_01040 [Muribaculaceae bacterium]|nr:hypothetical protein [Muribaculaceae bacterium]